MTTRDEFIETLKSKIDEWNAEITRLEAKAQKAGAEAKERYAEQINEMRKFRDDAEARLNEIMGASHDTWEKRRGELEQAWHDIRDGFSRAWSRVSGGS
jgi:chromosome segregation ATPase